MDGLFARSLDKNEKLVVIYMDSRGEVSQRSIRVMDIRGEDILVHCFAREKVRTLKKDRILSVFPASAVKRRRSAAME
ncbi:hypothetical protein CEH05_07790 [Halobacillus halophilus]|uniref:WYL domain-containing protein n=1 Tax=Halobacillus halophilus (strain ATCC 35676 / DSM 2266 / JCM 20832 / KCTC 3685 / LMG 17431 / NBRC 102448 / NCIMB 2269) TaxID=866895 RepID=I0JL75_HALH3|nr:hypothetical protein [Halobacillus halophilus]ASF39019.1 hypothetical protein CEH05_07790 [Halobacillus halophilus]CCG44895.1 hypothetical protein HBHAL_2549 [Halobacillus halophilus DSM 2266]